MLPDLDVAELEDMNVKENEKLEKCQDYAGGLRKIMEYEG